MAGDLAAEDAALGAHARLEEGVADAVDQRRAAGRLDDVGHRAARADVVEDRLAGVLAQHRAGEDRGQEVAVDERAGVVDEEAAVGVAVPGDPEVGALALDLAHDELAVLGQQRVGLVVGELAVGRPVAGREVEPELLEQRADHRPGHAVAAVDDDLQRLDGRGVDEAQHVPVELVVDLDLLDAAAARLVAHAALHERLDVADALVAGERDRAAAHELRAGVGLGVVRGGAHQAAVEVARADEEIQHLGADLAGVEHVRALGGHALGVGGRHLGRGQAHVAAEAEPAARPSACPRAARSPGRRRGRSRGRRWRRGRGRGCRGCRTP